MKYPIAMRYSELRYQARKLVRMLLDGFAQIRNARDPSIPPNAEKMVGGGDFHQIGNEFKKYFIELSGLQPHHSILDVGCGIGRMTIPLTTYINSEGEYQGIDIVAEGVDWCNRHISSTFQNFRFQHVDVINGHYNRNGKVGAEDFVFPFDDCYFDRVVLVSVFTHMLQKEVERYLEEIARVLKPGGRCLFTVFLLNEESKRMIDTGASSRKFDYGIENTAVGDDRDPQAAVAFDESHLLRTIHARGLRASLPIHYGSWCGRSDYLSYQDILVIDKVSA